MIYRLITLEGNKEGNKQGNMWVNAEYVKNWSRFCYCLKIRCDFRLILEGNEQDSRWWVNEECVKNWSVFCKCLKVTCEFRLRTSIKVRAR